MNKKILIATGIYPPEIGGSATYVKNFCDIFIEKGFEICVITYSDKKFYDEDKNYIESTILEAGDVILLAYGGHGFEMLEESEMIEVKQGPYVGEMDKTRFEPVSKDKLKIK